MWFVNKLLQNDALPNTHFGKMMKILVPNNDRLIKNDFVQIRQANEPTCVYIETECAVLICWIWFTLMYDDSWNWIQLVFFPSFFSPLRRFYKLFFRIPLMGLLLSWSFLNENRHAFGKQLCTSHRFPWKIQNYSFHVLMVLTIESHNLKCCNKF